MKIYEITEAKSKKPVSLGGGPIGASTQTKQRIAPATLQAVSDFRSYKKDAEKLKTPIEKEKKTKRKGSTFNWDGRLENYEDVLFGVLKLKLSADDLKHWHDTQDENFIFDKTIKFKTSKLPLELVKEMREDPVWQDIVKKLWNYALLSIQQSRKQYTHISRFITAGIPMKNIRDIENKLVNLYQSYLRKYGIDKTGRRVKY